MMNFEDENYLAHYGVGHLENGNSGRYPWGSGENPYQDGGSWYRLYSSFKEQGLSEQEIMEALNIGSSKELRETVTITRKISKREQGYRAAELRERGMSFAAIAKTMGLKNESSVRSLLETYDNKKQNATDNVVNVLKEAVDKYTYVDVGRGIDAQLGVTKTQFDAAIRQMTFEGYKKNYCYVTQLGTGDKTTMMVLTKNDVEYSDVYQAAKDANITAPVDYISKDSGQTFVGTQWPAELSLDRLQVVYGNGVVLGTGEQLDNTQAGAVKDGVIEIRPGLTDINLGSSQYAQVRIATENGYYLKGMAMYNKNLPEGVDVRFNTNKSEGKAIEDVLKAVKETDSPEGIFGATIKAGGQSYYEDANGKFKGEEIGMEPGRLYSLNLVNKVNEEGDWDNWSKNIPSQMLSKQDVTFAKQRLDEAYIRSKNEFEEIKSLTNPAVKQQLLQEYASSADTAAVNLKAAALPGQKTHVLIPITDLKDNEIYAPNFNNGDRVALIRFPHSGQFEIPELVVNNTSKMGREIIGNGIDAVGITSKTAEKLSGADFDGDTAIVMPNNNGYIHSAPMLDYVKNFDFGKYEFTNDEYKAAKFLNDYRANVRKGLDEQTIISVMGCKDKTELKERIAEGKAAPKLMTDAEKGKEMGVISNLITDMTQHGAGTDDLAKAVAHSMIVIDAVKHKYDFKQSEIDNDIPRLKKLYQAHEDSNGIQDGKSGGAQTIISRSKSIERIPEREEGAFVKKDGTVVNKLQTDVKNMTTEEKNDYILSSKGQPKVFYSHPQTGEKLYSETGRTIQKWDPEKKEYYDTGKLAEIEVTKMSNASDARDLIGQKSNKMEQTYAEYANNMKSLANQARLEYTNTPNAKLNVEAKKKYAEEVSSIEAKVLTAKKNAPLERKAQLIANEKVSARIKNDETLKADKDAVKKIKTQELNAARNAVGADGKGSKVKLTDKEWEAIQAGAISHSKQQELFNNCDKDQLKSLAMPRESKSISAVQESRILSMARNGYTQSVIADQLGLSASTVAKIIKESK